MQGNAKRTNKKRERGTGSLRMRRPPPLPSSPTTTLPKSSFVPDGGLISRARSAFASRGLSVRLSASRSPFLARFFLCRCLRSAKSVCRYFSADFPFSEYVCRFNRPDDALRHNNREKFLKFQFHYHRQPRIPDTLQNYRHYIVTVCIAGFVPYDIGRTNAMLRKQGYQSERVEHVLSDTFDVLRQRSPSKYRPTR